MVKTHPNVAMTNAYRGIWDTLESETNVVCYEILSNMNVNPKEDESRNSKLSIYRRNITILSLRSLKYKMVVRFEVFTAMTMNNIVFWNVVQCAAPRATIFFMKWLFKANFDLFRQNGVRCKYDFFLTFLK
jgi:hypothetical protein